ncbi:fasciculation and elongation protein zeta-2-like isoform X2 [Acanthaster planci]|uniref:Fasciculation and elongation protein zeta-2-like isoform X2 n=1 Tax=Acanthaster planci TaxID=133434 RepID=A0A8B7Z1B8_ACAPL|nr:fasciculation and elongation protein zeta-2-like isoform X2 [Acanthaster planci]
MKGGGTSEPSPCSKLSPRRTRNKREKTYEVHRRQVKKMAAPLAIFDDQGDPHTPSTEEWPEFIEFRGSSADDINSNGNAFPVLSIKEEICPDNFNERTMSIEDLVNNFDDKLAVCFRNYNLNTERIAPVKILTQEEVMKNCKIWKKVTDNMGQVMPLDWKNSHTRKLHMPTLNLCTKRNGDNLDLPEDHELTQCFDMHSMVLSSTPPEDQDPVITADRVIEEIDEIFQSQSDSSPDDQVDEDSLSNISRELQALRDRSITTSSYEESQLAQGSPELKCMTLSELNELLEDLEATIKEYSEALVTELALREDLCFEKETKNQFISALVAVQNKIKGFKKQPPSASGKKKNKNGVEPGTYLTTRIPYHKGSGPPDVQTLQQVTKILRAINEDSKDVPDLLTNYILKVLFKPEKDGDIPLPLPMDMQVR